MMQTDVTDVLNQLKTLSANTDRIINESNRDDDQITKWSRIIKETAKAIGEGLTHDTFRKSPRISNSSDKLLPSLVELINGKQSKPRENRLSNLLTENQKERVGHTNRKSRVSLRKLVFAKKSGNKWEVTYPKKSPEVNIIISNTFQDKSLESEIKSPRGVIACPGDVEKRFSNETNDSKQELVPCATPISSKDTSTPLADTTPVTRSKTKAAASQVERKEVLATGSVDTPVTGLEKGVPITQVLKKGKKKFHLSSQNDRSNETFTPDVVPKSESNYSEQLHNDNEILSTSSELQGATYLTPQNQTIDLVESDNSSEKRLARSKRKSSVQLSRDYPKRVKNATGEHYANNTKKQFKPVLADKNSSKRVRLQNNSSVIPANISNVNAAQNLVQNEKRILREIQKKEEIVNQNSKKIKSMREIKIQEKKKNREVKMEKAMQLRMKMEKEKEERLRCRTLSKQENAVQKESASKKTTQRRLQEQEDNRDSSKQVYFKKKNLLSSDKKGLPKEISNESELPKKAPPKPVRTPAKEKGTPSTPIMKSASKKINDIKEGDKTYSCDSANKLPTGKKELFAKPHAIDINTTYVSSPAANTQSHLTSTPAAKKVESKINLTKTPVSNSAHKPTSYTMTPCQSSFVSYDISEIKSDDSEDEEEERKNHKPIPSWATGIQLRNTLINQHYNPIDTDALFGNSFEMPNLVEIMGNPDKPSKRYFKRTSSAIWASSPNRSIIS